MINHSGYWNLSPRSPSRSGSGKLVSLRKSLNAENYPTHIYIQSQLGHSSPAVTLNVYANLMNLVNQASACRLEKTIFSATGSKMAAGVYKMKSLIPSNSHHTTIHTPVGRQKPIKKGLTSLSACKPLSNLVGDTGFEPVTSTV